MPGAGYSVILDPARGSRRAARAHTTATNTSPTEIMTSNSRPAWTYRNTTTSGASTATAKAHQRRKPRLMRNQ